MTYWVTMTDKFLSYWPSMGNRISKLVIECDEYWQAEQIYEKALARPEMGRVRIRTTKPTRYNNDKRYLVSHRLFKEIYW